jgi:hypothetical protein
VTREKPSIVATDAIAEGSVNMKATPSTHVRVPVEMARRLERLLERTKRAYAGGRLSVPPAMADRIPVWYVIQKALDEQEARRERSRRPRPRKVPATVRLRAQP